MNVGESNYNYQIGGCLPPDAPTYVERQADSDLYDELMAGHFCYVLNSRQMGKSSLRVRTMRRLQAAGFACAVIDLTEIGTQRITPEQWYASLVNILVRNFGLELRLGDWWREQEPLSFLNRFSIFIESVLLKEINQDIVILVDEIDSVMSLSFGVEDFFALIRSFYNQRADNPVYNRLTFAVFGVATPNDLIRNQNSTPFNIGTPIELTGFDQDEAEPLARGLMGEASNPQLVLREVLDWTGGQPFLTQKLCRLISLSTSPIPEGEEQECVDNLVNSQIIDNWESQDTPEHLKTIRDRLLYNKQFIVSILTLYQQTLQNGEVAVDNSLEQAELRMSGLVVKKQNKLKVHNWIYQYIFNEEWVKNKLARIRPYNAKLEAWIASNRNGEHLLQAQELQEAKEWAKGKSLSAQDYEFLKASEAQQELRQKVKQLIKWSLVVIFAIIAPSLGGLWWLERQNAQNALAGKLESRASLIQNQQTNLLQRRILLRLEAMKRNPSRVVKPALYEELSLLSLPALSMPHENNVNAVAFSPGGDYLATTSTDDTARVWETTSGKEVARLRHQNNVNAVASSPDGKYLATASTDGTARVWDATSGKEVARMPHEDGVNDVAFSPDGKYLATASADDTARVWDSTSGKEVARIPHEDGVNDVAFSPDGKYLATSSADETARVWETTSGKEVARMPHEGRVVAVVFSPDGEYLATASADETARLWETTSGKPIGSPLEHESLVMTVAFSPDGKYLATSSADETARVWQTASGKEVARMPHQNKVSAIVFSPDGEYLATASADDTARTWDTTGGKAVVRKKLKRSVKALTPGGKYFATTRDDTAQVWKITSDMKLKKEGFPLEHNDVNSVAFSPKLDGKYVATVGANNDAKVWKIANSKLLELLPLHKEQERNISALAISPDRKYLVAVDLGKTARAWNTISSQPVSLLKENNREPKDFVETVTFSPDGKYFATASLDNTIQVWRIISGKKVKLNPQPKNVANAVAFSPDGKYLATVSDDNTARIWEITSGKKMEFSLEHSDGVNAIAFSPDGKYLATASDDKTVRIRKITSGKKFPQTSGKKFPHLAHRNFAQTSGKKIPRLDHRNDVNAVAFSQDENYLVTVSDDNIVRVQPWRSPDLVDRACNYLTRNLTEEEWNYYLGDEPYRKTCPNLQSGATHSQSPFKSAFRAVRTWIHYTFL